MNDQELEQRIDEKVAALRGEVDIPEDNPEPELQEVPAPDDVSEDAEGDIEEAPAEDAAPEEEPSEEEAAVEEAQNQLLAGQYKSVEELERAVEEKQLMIERQADEVGQSRKERAELAALVEELRQRTEADIADLRSQGFEPDDEWEEWADEQILDRSDPLNPIYAITTAGREAGPEAARFVLNQWYKHDPAAAMAFQMEIGATEEPMEQYVQDTPAEGEIPDEVVDISLNVVAERFPDLGEYMPQMRDMMLSMPGEERERWEQRIAADPSNGEVFLENLYGRAKAQALETNLSGREKAAQQAKNARADKEAAEATVATATASASRVVTAPRRNDFDRDAFRKEAGLAPKE